MSRRTRRRRIFVAAVLGAAMMGCDDDAGPVTVDPVPGEVTLVIAGGGGDAAALLELDADDVTAVSSDSAAVHTASIGGRLRVALVRATAGELSLKLAVRDTAAALNIELLEVADASNGLRPSLAGYIVEVRR